jgi:pectate lyase
MGTLLLSSLLVGCGGSSSSDSGASSSSVESSSSSASSTPHYAEYCEKVNTVHGFASMDAGTTGGADTGEGNYVVGVTTGNELRAAVYGSASPYNDKPLTVYIDGLITWENSGNSDIRIERSDVSIIGRSENAGFEGVGIEVKALQSGTGNIIIRNLTMRLVPQSNGSGDIISLDGRDGPVRNIWIDHNELYNSLITEGCTTEACHKDHYDELVSGRADVGNVTISYNYLHDSWKTSLWGSSDSDEANRTVTFHHNWWQDVNSRLPLYRFGELHVFNNYYEGVTGTGINVRMDAVARIDGTVFENVRNPIVSIDSSRIGYWEVEDNLFSGITTSDGSCTSGAPPCYNAHTISTGEYVPPYTYDHILLPASEVKQYVVDNAGPGTITSCLELPAP